jgi:Uroporphyrinogen decarboxylase (URO-D)
MEKKWEDMSADEKQEATFQKLLSPKDPEGNDLKFKSPEAETRYKASIQRIKDALQLKEPADRVPVCIFSGMYPLDYYGITLKEAMYDYEKCVAAWRKFLLDFQPDLSFGAAGPGPGKFYEIIDYKLYGWPGHGVKEDANSYQCFEDEYMGANEYDLLLTDPSFYFNHFYLPKVFGALEGFTMLPPPTGILEMYGVAFNFVPYALPPVQNTLKALTEAGAEALKWAGVVGAFDGEMTSMGIPNILGGFTKAPFDTIGDTLRGTKGIMLDMYRQPDKLHQALEALTPIMIGMGLGAAQQTGNPLIFIPLHKGADGFLSDAQFKEFYWPTLKQVVLGLIDGGCIPFLAAEGGYNSRLEDIRDLPAGKTIWMMDQTDMTRAKEIVGDTLCLFGNMHSSMLKMGTTDEIKEYAKELIDVAGKGGGYIMGNGSFFDHAKPENIQAWVEFSKEYGACK